jgi:hypothetical protein
MRLLILILFLPAYLTISCGNPHRVMHAKQGGKFFDHYFVLKKKKYKYYTRLIFNASHMRGRYAISHDTIYLLTKRKRVYYMDGYGIVNQDSASVVVYGLDSLESRTFEIMYYRK